jgi:hypothetical protein
MMFSVGRVENSKPGLMLKTGRDYPAGLFGFRRARVLKRKLILPCALPDSGDQSLGWLKQPQGL